MTHDTQSTEKQTKSKSALLPVLVAALSFFLGLAGWWFQEWYKRSSERDNISRALLIEIHQVNSAVYGRLDFWSMQVDPTEWLPPLSPFYTDTFDQIGDNVGLLEQDLARAIVEYHGYISFTNRYQEFREEYVKEDKSAEFYKRYNRLLCAHLRFRGDKRFQEFYQRYDLAWPQSSPDTDKLIEEVCKDK